MPRLQEKGFSLVEVVFAIGILIVVMLSFYELPAWWAKNEKGVALTVTKDRLFKTFSESFIELTERADVALRFENLPISASCTGNGPCVRMLKTDASGDTFQPADVTLNGIQMMKDEEGPLQTTDLPNAQGVVAARLQSKKAYALDFSILQGDYYATWPLVDASSAPFVIMRRSAVGNTLIVDNAFISSNSDSCAGGGCWSIVRGSASGIDFSPAVGRPMIVYNPTDTTQYTVQKLVAIKDCAQALQFCKQMAQTTYGSPIDFSTAWYKGQKAAFESLKFYAVQLAPMDANDLTYQGSNQETFNFLPATSFPPSNWNNQGSGLFLFPSNVFTLSSPLGNAIGDLQPPAFANHLGHFLHTLGSSVELMMMPIDLVAYRIVAKSDSSGKTKNSLKFQVLGAQNSVSVLDDIPSGNQIYFARKLGTSELSVFQLQ